jgi:hypothetical protein
MRAPAEHAQPVERKQPFKRDSDRQRFLEGYRKAGLPD